MKKTRIFFLLSIIFFVVILIRMIPALAQNLPGQPILQAKQIVLGVLKDNKDYEESREAFVQFLESKGDLSLEFRLIDAQGSLSFYKNELMRMVRDEKIDLIFTMGTRGTLPAIPVSRYVPVVFSAVADPIGSGIVDRFDQRTSNITGSHCRVPAYAQIKTLLKVLPDIQKMGIVYTQGEKNAEIQLEEFVHTAKDFDIDIVTSSVSEDCQSEEEIRQSTNRIIDQVDVFVILQDTSLSVYGQGLISVALEHQVPVYSSLSHLLPYGALLSLSANFNNIGLIAGRQAYRILAQGEKAQNLEITTDKKYLLVVNLKVAKELNIQIPVQVLKTASRIIK